VQASLEALQPLVVSATSGQTSQSSVPAGPLPAFGQLLATPAAGVSASVSWNATAADSGAFLALSHSLAIAGGATGSGSVGPLEFRVTLTASSAASAAIEVRRSDNLGGSIGAATIALDLNNDGNYEIPDLSIGSYLSPFSAALSATPFQFRVKISNQAAAPGVSGGQVVIQAMPDIGITVTPTAVNCSPVPDVIFFGYPVFTNSGYVFRADAIYGSRLAVMVVGLAQQPILLPQLGPAPCILVPRPDVLLPVLPSQDVTFGIPLPASVRPVTLQGQLVYLEPQGQLSVSDAWAVSAQ
jgi:hypothetical protein